MTLPLPLDEPSDLTNESFTADWSSTPSEDTRNDSKNDAILDTDLENTAEESFGAYTFPNLENVGASATDVQDEMQQEFNDL